MLIDLTIPFRDRMPTFPGDPPAELSQVSDVANNGYQLHKLSTGLHAGTHIDAPSHMLSDGRSISDLDLNTFIGNAICIDATNGFSLNTLQNIDFTNISILLFNTGTHHRFGNEDYFKIYPVMPTELAKFIISRNIKLIGLDTCSADNSPDFPIHRLLLSNQIPIIENLTNLDQVNGKQFNFYGFPLAIPADGSPIRAVAEISQ